MNTSIETALLVCPTSADAAAMVALLVSGTVALLLLNLPSAAPPGNCSTAQRMWCLGLECLPLNREIDLFGAF